MVRKRMRPFNEWLLVGLLVLFALFPTVESQGGQGDGGSGGDAPNDQADALALTEQENTIPRSNFYTGSLGGSDADDWYKFQVDHDGPAGRPILELTLFTDRDFGYDLELFRSTTAEDPIATGEGSGGALYLRYSADLSGSWVIHIAGDSTGDYQFSVSVLKENDAGQGKDAEDEAGGALNLGQPASSGVFVSGTLTAGDPGDQYRFANSGGDPVLVSLVSPRRNGTLPEAFDLDLSGANPGGVVVETERSGPGFRTILGVQGGTGDYTVRVLRTTTSNNLDGTYLLAIRLDPLNSGDMGTGSDAPEDDDAGFVLTEGIHTARLLDTDTSDWFRITGVTAGETLRIGVSSHTNQIDRPFLRLTIQDQSKQTVDSFNVCGDARGLTWTAAGSGTWYVNVQEISDACGILTPTDDFYTIFLDRALQADAGSGDAPAAVSSAPPLTLGSLQTAWFDPGDAGDSYSLGTLSTGQIVRVVVASTVPDMEFRATLFRSNTVVAADPVDSSNGALRTRLTVGQAGSYQLQITPREVRVDELGDEHEAPLVTSGNYRFYARTFGDEPPVPVTLADPTPLLQTAETSGNVARTSIKLDWTRSVDDDFRRYEVHFSTSSNFAPNASTRAANITSRDTLTHTVTGLTQGTSYTFLIRVVDLTGNHGDSNRQTQSTRNIQNTPPTLSEGNVDPDQGDASTTFTYSVRYTDADNDAPSLARVVIDGVLHNMATADTNYTDGSNFVFSTALPEGQHSFFFEFSDGDSTVREPDPQEDPDGVYSGPTVIGQGNLPPTVDASGSPSSGEAPLTVTFTAPASDPDGDSLSYSWDFDNSNGIQSQSNLQNPQHTYEDAGTFTATVRVSDSRGATSTDSVTTEVLPQSNEPPQSNPTATPSSGLAPLAVAFNANAQDPDGSIAAYEWDFDNADGLQTESSDAMPQHTYTTAGTFTASVRVTDNGGRNSTGSVTVTVSTPGNGPPSVSIDASDDRGPAPLEVTFDALTADPDGDAVTVTWDFDQSDGVTAEATGTTVEHTFGNPGRYVVTARVADSEGATGAATVEIVALASEFTTPVPIFIVVEAVDPDNPLNVTFHVDVELTDALVESYLWDFGDGETSTEGPNVEHSYAEAGTYTVRVVVTDDIDREFESTREVEVGEEGGVSNAILLITIGGVLAAIVAVAGYLIFRARGA